MVTTLYILASLTVNPPKSASAQFIDKIIRREPSDNGSIYWVTEADSITYHLDITGVENHQRCYELCQLLHGGICWLFRWVWGQQQT